MTIIQRRLEVTERAIARFEQSLAQSDAQEMGALLGKAMTEALESQLKELREERAGLLAARLRELGEEIARN